MGIIEDNKMNNEADIVEDEVTEEVAVEEEEEVAVEVTNEEATEEDEVAEIVTPPSLAECNAVEQRHVDMAKKKAAEKE